MEPIFSGVRVCLINPRFEPSFWGFEYLLPLLDGDKRCWMAGGALPLLAALAPPGVDVTIVDENVREIDWDALRAFDVVAVTGMIVQRARMFDILARARSLGALVVAGGPYVSIAESAFIGRCDVRFVGEADRTWPEFLRAVGERRPYAERYEQRERTDVTRLPLPRFDLVDAARYVTAAVQFSRGCPFQCEFCDIITIFGRRPRVKTTAQLLAELDAVRRTGIRIVFLVDDNFIGNKAAARDALRELIAWQERHGYPLQLSTEASINLADEPELMDLMTRANLRHVFVGLESPRADSLNEVRKVQNTRGDPMLAKIARIRDAGLVIQGGFIVGFDHDDVSIFAEQDTFITRAGIAQAGVAILSPLPTTPLYDRLAAAGRLDDSDREVAFIPALMTQQQLREGHDDLMRRLFEPDAYFARIFAGFAGSPAFRARRRELDARLARPGVVARIARDAAAIRIAARLSSALARRGVLRRLGGAYVRSFLGANRALGREAIPFAQFVSLCATHWHFWSMACSPRKMSFGNPMLEAREERAS